MMVKYGSRQPGCLVKYCPIPDSGTNLGVQVDIAPRAGLADLICWRIITYSVRIVKQIILGEGCGRENLSGKRERTNRRLRQVEHAAAWRPANKIG